MTPIDTDSSIDTSAVRRRYDHAARFYDYAVWPMEFLAMDRFRRRLLPLVRGPRVLEVGVGTGRNLAAYDVDLKIDAIDLSSEMLRRARRRRYAADVTLLEMDVQGLAFPSNMFDTVVSTCVFCSVPDPVLGLAEVRRVLRPDGQALLLEHVRPGGRWLGPMFDTLDPLVSRFGPHINRRTVDNIRAAGLSVVHETDLLSDIVKLIVARR
jgi:ubiquinone/menaquinone biosynthesis C-methylase UbiE